MALELWRWSFAAAGVGTFGVRDPHATGRRGDSPVPRCRRFLSVGLGGETNALRRAEWSLEPDEPMDTARPTVPLGNAGGGLRPTRFTRYRWQCWQCWHLTRALPRSVGRGSIPKSNQAIFARAAVALSLSNQQQNPVRISVHVACRKGQDWYSLSGASGVLQVGELNT
jgi:hypothetical protein